MKDCLAVSYAILLSLLYHKISIDKIIIKVRWLRFEIESSFKNNANFSLCFKNVTSSCGHNNG